MPLMEDASWEPERRPWAQKFVQTLAMSVFAAYAPTLVWIGFLPPGTAGDLFLPVSPIALLLLWGDFGIVGAWCILALFFLVLVALAAGLSWIRAPHTLVPLRAAVLVLIVIYSLVQGLCCAPIVRGLNAL